MKLEKKYILKCGTIISWNQGRGSWSLGQSPLQKEVTGCSLRLRLTAWTQLFDLLTPLLNSTWILGNNQENLMKHEIRHVTKVPRMTCQMGWKSSYDCNICWNIWSPKPSADDSHMQWPSSPADKHCVHNSSLATENSWENKAIGTRNSNVDTASVVTKNEIKCGMSFGNC